MIYLVSAELDCDGIIENTISVCATNNPTNGLGIVHMIPFADGRYAAWTYICLTHDDTVEKITDDAVVSGFKSLVKLQVAPYTVIYVISGSSRDFCSAIRRLTVVQPLRLKINENGNVEGTVLAVDEHDAIMQAKAYAAKRLYELKDIPSC